MRMSPHTQDVDFVVHRGWMDEGTSALLTAVEGLTDEALSDPTALPGWTRRHIMAHVAANADALARLANWAKTGQESRMYASPQQRAEEIAAGAVVPAPELRRWLRDSAAKLQVALDSLNPDQWSHEVITARGRTVPATQLPWMRSREVMVHAVDLRSGISFAQLTSDFVAALVDDVVAKRSDSAGPSVTVTATDAGLSWHIDGQGAPTQVIGTLADIAAWLTGRSAPHVATVDGQEPPDLPAWL